MNTSSDIGAADIFSACDNIDKNKTTGTGNLSAAHDNTHVKLYGARIIKSRDIKTEKPWGVVRIGRVVWCSSYGAAIMEAERAPYDSWTGNPAPVVPLW